MTHSCRNCGTTYRNVDRDEDGAPYIETTRCQQPGCEIHLCANCDQFHCDGCGQWFCVEHRKLDYGPQPACTCSRLDVDRYDASGCELCDPESDYNRRPLRFCPACYRECQEQIEPMPPGRETAELARREVA